jgi:uncharacterized protein YgbK (DUF1537 family)
MRERWLIVADDLTGATDCGAAFARRGQLTEAFWDEPAPAQDVAVWAYDAATRYLPPNEAWHRQRDAALRWLAPDRGLYQKIDSTLRGHPAAEAAALSSALRELRRPDWSLCAPANPAMGRATRDARVWVRDEPLELTRTWLSEHSHASADLVEIFASANLRPLELPLDRVRSPDFGADLRAAAREAARQPGSVVICDAETDADLRCIAAAARGPAAPGFFVGSAGLAQALAADGPAADSRAVSLPPTKRGTLIVVGSMAEVSRAAVARLAGRPDVRRVGIKVADLRDDYEPDLSFLVPGMAASLVTGENVLALLGSGSDEKHASAPQPEFVRNAAVMLGPALRNMGGLIVTGGETAAALLAECYVQGIRLLDEIEPGLALGITRGEIQVPIVTKPGAFGDEGSLARCLDRMKELRRSE